MPADKVFITGATGFIGAHVADQSLKAGFHVRLAVRKAEQAEELKRRWSAFAQQLETVVIPDFTVANAFDKTLDGVTYVFHLATPMPAGDAARDLKRDFVAPAISGTISILEAALSQPSIKTIIVTSSVAGLLPVQFPAQVVVSDNTGEDIPVDLDIDIPEDHQGSFTKYRISKILAHKATKEFLKERKPHYKLLTFHPTAVVGHSLTQKTPEGLEGMNAPWWDSLQLDKPVVLPGWVSVGDVATAHLKALKTDIPTGTEMLLDGQTVDWTPIVPFLKKKYPLLDVKLTPPYGKSWDVDTATADKYLGIEWKSMVDIADEIVAQQLAFRKV